jgi:hypothetical protein
MKEQLWEMLGMVVVGVLTVLPAAIILALV